MLNSLLLILVLALISVNATPLIDVRNHTVTIPILARLNATGRRIPDIDRDRALRQVAGVRNNTRKQGKRGVVSSSIVNEAVTYIANVGIGTPPQTYQLIVDTGSSNTWTNAQGNFIETSSTVNTGLENAVQYGSGFFSGELIVDTVEIAPGLSVDCQALGVAENSEGFEGVDGILGLGPVDLTEGTISEPGTVPTVTDNLFSQLEIPENQVSIFFAPTTMQETTNGELTFGGVDSSKVTGAITFIPITASSPANEFWGIDQSVTYGSTQTLLATAAGIVDTGTSLFLLETNSFNKYTSSTKATEDETTGLLTITTANYASLQSLFIHAGGTAFEFTKNAQTWPRALNTAIGGVASSIYLVVADLGNASDEGFSFINGFVFLERFLSVFDTDNKRVGLATTAHTNDETN